MAVVNVCGVSPRFCFQCCRDFREMIAPGALVMLTPLFVGFLFGTGALAGVLAGSLVSGVAMAISSSNSGGAWDNAKKVCPGLFSPINLSLLRHTTPVCV